MSKPSNLYHNLEALPASARGSLLAIGNFDGVHLGHQAVIKQARENADKLGCPLGVMLFNPHPRQFFAPDAPPFRLTRLPTRARLLADLGVDFTLALPFDAELAACPASQFIDTILINALGISGVSVGHDFHFGKDRQGTPDMLQQRGALAGFEVFITPAVLQADSEAPYSSSAIRQHLRDGDVRAAAALLGHSWSIEGSVNHGDKRGRTIGTPTANMELGDYLQPAFGVYAVRAEILSGPCRAKFMTGWQIWVCARPWAAPRHGWRHICSTLTAIYTIRNWVLRCLILFGPNRNLTGWTRSKHKLRATVRPHATRWPRNR